MIYNMPISHNLVVNVVVSETRGQLFVTATPHVKTMNTRWDGVQTYGTTDIIIAHVSCSTL